MFQEIIEFYFILGITEIIIIFHALDIYEYICRQLIYILITEYEPSRTVNKVVITTRTLWSQGRISTNVRYFFYAARSLTFIELLWLDLVSKLRFNCFYYIFPAFFFVFYCFSCCCIISVWKWLKRIDFTWNKLCSKQSSVCAPCIIKAF